MHRKLRALHRYLGIIVALVISLLTLTEILLNHTDTLKLNKKPTHNTLLLSWYGVHPPSFYSVKTDNAWINFC